MHNKKSSTRIFRNCKSTSKIHAASKLLHALRGEWNDHLPPPTQKIRVMNLVGCTK